MKLILTDGIERDVILVTGAQLYVQGANRDALTFVFPGTTSIDEIDKAFTEENCNSITLIDDEGSEFIHKDYTIRTELVKKNVILNPSDETDPQAFETRVMITMSQKTFSEKQISSLNKNVNSLMLEVFGRTDIEEDSNNKEII